MGLITHFRQMHLALEMPKDAKYSRPLGCDLCDAFLVINGFTTFAALEKHTKEVHGDVSSIKVQRISSCNATNGLLSGNSN